MKNGVWAGCTVFLTSILKSPAFRVADFSGGTAKLLDFCAKSAGCRVRSAEWPALDDFFMARLLFFLYRRVKYRRVGRSWCFFYFFGLSICLTWRHDDRPSGLFVPRVARLGLLLVVSFFLVLVLPPSGISHLANWHYLLPVLVMDLKLRGARNLGRIGT